jgi:hypothetical protein
MIASLAGPVYAEDPVPQYGSAEKVKTPREIDAEKQAERAYQRSLKNIPDQGGASDPWGTVRSDSGPKPAAKAVAPAKRTTSTAK